MLQKSGVKAKDNDLSQRRLTPPSYEDSSSSTQLIESNAASNEIMQPPLHQHDSSNGAFEDNLLSSENQAYEYSSQHQALRQDQPLGAKTASHSSSSSLEQSNQLRSSPIAIVRPPTEKPSEPFGFETDDDDDSVIDIVERDAIRLRKKYGKKVVAASSSYTAGVMDSSTSSILSKTMLKAPYLGSLSKSENFLMNLPPMRLSETNSSYGDEPPMEITSYGSLRESHRRGQFLDGPSSYREPRSGQIFPLDDRIRYRVGGGGLGGAPPKSLSIGERIQQARKLKETGGDGGEKPKSAGTSSLSAIMDMATKTTTDENHEELATSSELDQFNSNAMDDDMVSHELSAFSRDEMTGFDKFGPSRRMLSTSMTAYEILSSSSNKPMAGYQKNHTQRFVEQQQQNSAACSSAAASAAAATTKLPSASEIREQRFQPLSRSLSDPTPHHLQRSPRLTSSSAATVLQTIPSPHSNNHASQSSEIANSHGWTTPYNLPGDIIRDPSVYAYAAEAMAHTNHAVGPADNPDTDGAFDMDIE